MQNVVSVTQLVSYCPGNIPVGTTGMLLSSAGLFFLFVTHRICGLCVPRGRGQAGTTGAMPALASLRITLHCLCWKMKAVFF